MVVRGKQRALLARLLLEPGKAVSREHLIDDLWGDDPPETAAKAVQVFADRLRKALPGIPLGKRGTAYSLDIEPIQVDTHRFERELDAGRRALAEGRPAEAAEAVAAALALWRGPALADVEEPFARLAAARLDDLRLAAHEIRIDAELALGRQTRVVGELEELVATHPLRERFRAQHMLALYRSGRQAEALEAYREARRTLVDELGLEPSRELQRLERAILAQDATLDEPPLEAETQQTAAASPSRGLWRQPAVLAAVPLALAALAIGAALVGRGSPGGLSGVSANSVGIIDPGTNRIVAEIPVGIRPGPIAAGRNALWVGNLEDRTLMRIDPRRRRVVATIPLENRTPTGIAVGARAVWVAHGLRGQLSRVDPQFKYVTPIEVTHSLGDRQLGAIAYGSGSVWAVYGDGTLARVDPLSLRIRDSSFAGTAPGALAVYAGAVWVANSEDATVQRFNAVTLEPVKTISVGRRPIAVVAGEGALWVANSGAASVTRIDPSGDNTQIPVGAGPTAVAVGAGAVWVANADDGTLSRIDPATSKVVRTIELGNAPAGIAIVDDLVWVTVREP